MTQWTLPRCLYALLLFIHTFCLVVYYQFIIKQSPLGLLLTPSGLLVAWIKSILLLCGSCGIICPHLISSSEIQSTICYEEIIFLFIAKEIQTHCTRVESEIALTHWQQKLTHCGLEVSCCLRPEAKFSVSLCCLLSWNWGSLCPLAVLSLHFHLVLSWYPGEHFYSVCAAFAGGDGGEQRAADGGSICCGRAGGWRSAQRGADCLSVLRLPEPFEKPPTLALKMLQWCRGGKRHWGEELLFHLFSFFCPSAPYDLLAGNWKCLGAENRTYGFF